MPCTNCINLGCKLIFFRLLARIRSNSEKGYVSFEFSIWRGRQKYGPLVPKYNFLHDFYFEVFLSFIVLRRTILSIMNLL
jgi:hypothetical protein